MFAYLPEFPFAESLTRPLDDPDGSFKGPKTGGRSLSGGRLQPMASLMRYLEHVLSDSSAIAILSALAFESAARGRNLSTDPNMLWLFRGQLYE